MDLFSVVLLMAGLCALIVAQNILDPFAHLPPDEIPDWWFWVSVAVLLAALGTFFWAFWLAIKIIF